MQLKSSLESYVKHKERNSCWQEQGSQPLNQRQFNFNCRLNLWYLMKTWNKKGTAEVLGFTGSHHMHLFDYRLVRASAFLTYWCWIKQCWFHLQSTMSFSLLTLKYKMPLYLCITLPFANDLLLQQWLLWDHSIKQKVLKYVDSSEGEITRSPLVLVKRDRLPFAPSYETDTLIMQLVWVNTAFLVYWLALAGIFLGMAIKVFSN